MHLTLQDSEIRRILVKELWKSTIALSWPRLKESLLSKFLKPSNIENIMLMFYERIISVQRDFMGASLLAFINEHADLLTIVVESRDV